MRFEIGRPWRVMLWSACLVIGGWTAAAQTAEAGPQKGAQPPPAAQARSPLPAGVAAIRDEILKTNDARGLPFLILEKERAQLHVFDPLGTRLGSSPILLGPPLEESTAGTFMARPIPAITIDADLAPSGRYVAEQGVNLQGEDVVWIDFDAGLAMERLPDAATSERRRPRANAPKARGNRIACSCLNVPAGFFDQVVKPTLGPGKAVVYLLPEKAPLARQRGPLASATAWSSTHFDG